MKQEMCVTGFLMQYCVILSVLGHWLQFSIVSFLQHFILGEDLAYVIKPTVYLCLILRLFCPVLLSIQALTVSQCVSKVSSLHFQSFHL